MEALAEAPGGDLVEAEGANMNEEELFNRTVREQNRFFVSGLIVNDVNGPKRWCEFIEASSAIEAELTAKAMVDAMVVEGRCGVLWVANVLQVVYDEGGNPEIGNADKYAVYGDDPDRLAGYAPDGGYTPPRGFEGYV